ncbi:hypothetical protein PU629_19595 [Pullulanibacillus sp. KACC 23026]|uniref:hypothetical protein n=1 Tax=Pullulanibacillus sp. KACC 23026 TaxID=3028315 RepID=UPI0023AEC213|nr:hypothetical protein [Pullulanibacillus sp. KACC 23026]WEG12273.1 hypothetical protein PU629_19595 [Pullulanibacillus sp. KACC 23026]
MYVGRDLMALTMVPKSEWTVDELAHFNHCFQQITPYLNSQGVSLRNEIVEEIESRDDFRHRDEADWQNGTQVNFD